MPNNKVNWQSLHTELMKQSDERHAMEIRLIDVLSGGLQGIREDMAKERTDCNTRFLTIENDIVGLKVADRKWAGLAGLITSAVAGIGIWFGQK